MSYDKVTKAVNRLNAFRITNRQKGIYLMYNDTKWLSDSRVGKFSKNKSMYCGCPRCRAWAKEGKAFRLQYQLEKAGMVKYDGWEDYCKPIAGEEEWV